MNYKKEWKKKKIKKVLSEYKAKKLKSGSGKSVNSRDQALAIALSYSKKGKK